MTERLLLLSAIAVLPLQDHVPPIFGMSVMFIVFVSLAAYVMLWRISNLGAILRHPLLLAAWALVFVGFLMELANGSDGFYEIWRIMLMIVGAVLMATLCRDRQAMRFGFYGFVLAGIGLSVLLFLTVYGKLGSATAISFDEASKLREEVFADSPLEANLNAMAFFAAQGAAVALGMGITEKRARRRLVFLALGTIGIVGTFLPMSRGGVITLALACGAVLYAHGVMHLRSFITIGLLILVVSFAVPDAVFQRFQFSTEKRYGRMEGRAAVYTAIVTNLPEYVLTGVGVGNFRDHWGRRHGFGSVGTHNCFAQVTVYWGLAGLMTLLVVAWQAYRCIPRRCGADPLSLCLLAIAVSALAQSLVSHTLYAKEFSLALGILVAGSYWIWPKGIVQKD